jgi:hypothetical protein
MRRIPSLYTEGDGFDLDNDQCTPEKLLIAAVLGRALQDLCDRKERKQALHWFLESEDNAPGISFRFCISILNLGYTHIRAINQRIFNTLAGQHELTKLQRLRRVSTH